MPKPDVILCDLDGTITDSWPGILRCLRHALPSVGLEHLTDEDIRAFLGPPLKYTLMDVYGRSDADVEAFVIEYRSEYFSGGEYEFAVYPGMAELIADLGASDVPLVLATAKPIESAERVLTSAGLIEHFDFVSGSGLDLNRQDKPGVIAHGIEGIGADPARVSAVMIGDRKEDVLGAQHFGYDSIGVLWGYGGEAELTGVQATHVVGSTDEIRAILAM